MQVEEIARLLVGENRTVSVAEADTCGLIGYMLSTVPGAYKYFPGGVIAYSNSVKRKVLRVSEEALNEGSVSSRVALEMARGAREAIETDVGVSCTGIAGPTGGTPQKPVGLFYIGLSAADGTERWEELRLQSDDRDGNKRATAQVVLDLLGGYLQEKR